jgi:KaiC/GvpD/RAD55 family RecA-like ATPase
MTVPPGRGPYALGGAIPDGSVDSLPQGTNLLVVGDDADGAADFVFRVLAQAPRAGECVLLVTTDETPAALVDRYRTALDDTASLDHLFVVDVSQSGLERDIGPLSPTQVEAVASPADVTAIGIGITNHLRSIDTERIRFGLASLSPIVDRIGPERAFAFAHVLTSRVRTADYLGLFVVDPASHDASVVRILRSLTDGTLTVRRTDDGHRELHGTGALDAVATGTRFD